ncbi:hypothetical protein DAEQUDRAFT_238405 [Daedalea quercina L-15889]|uniref:DUF6533 domain-containing protein n=1 Tax=Daedalea quercina L-15889 TaxID=1314783 RepID=A0A165KG86_9APHY|nr:hypothetical protein DAEQUDRAFT_238405 [Daedalea quercina L-15889]
MHRCHGSSLGRSYVHGSSGSNYFDPPRRCCSIAACAVYFYDRCLTFSRETEIITRRQSMSLATFLYLLLHASATAYQCAGVVGIILTECKRYGPSRSFSCCNLLAIPYRDYIANVVQDCAGALFSGSIGGFTALRAYAIGNRSLLLASVMMAFTLLNVITSIYQISGLYAVSVPQPVGCVLTSDRSAEANRMVVIIGQLTSLIPEILLVATTWRHAYRVKVADSAGINTPLTTILLRDGTVYFAPAQSSFC